MTRAWRAINNGKTGAGCANKSANHTRIDPPPQTLQITTPAHSISSNQQADLLVGVITGKVHCHHTLLQVL